MAMLVIVRKLDALRDIFLINYLGVLIWPVLEPTIVKMTYMTTLMP